MLRLHLATTLDGVPVALGRDADEARTRALFRLREADNDEPSPVTSIIQTATATTLTRMIRLDDVAKQLAELGL